jgi:hypothetical protein
MLLDAPRLSSYLRAKALDAPLDAQQLAIEQQRKLKLRHQQSSRRKYASADQLSWKFFCANAQPRGDDEKRHFEVYRAFVGATKQMIQAELSSEELHSAMFLLYQLLAQDFIRSDAFRDEQDELLAFVNSEQLAGVVEVFGAVKPDSVSQGFLLLFYNSILTILFNYFQFNLNIFLSTYHFLLN